MSKIGIYFINSDNEIISNIIDYEKGRYFNGLYDSEDEHWNLFDRLFFKFETDDYINVPRGRVIYDKENDRSIIYIDLCYLSNKKILKKIIKLFEVENYVLEMDVHYQCPNCLVDIWKD